LEKEKSKIKQRKPVFTIFEKFIPIPHS